jgi:hypothetical protein
VVPKGTISSNGGNASTASRSVTLKHDTRTVGNREQRNRLR